jgi:hypothetical protein
MDTKREALTFTDYVLQNHKTSVFSIDSLIAIDELAQAYADAQSVEVIDWVTQNLRRVRLNSTDTVKDFHQSKQTKP